MAFTSSLNFKETLTQEASGSLTLLGSGSTGRTDIFSIAGNNGTLFSVSDDLSDSLFSVNTIAGLPVIEAFADNKVNIGKYGAESIVVSGSGGDLQLSGSVKLISLGTAADTNVVVFNSTTKKLAYNTALSLQGVQGTQGTYGTQGTTGTATQGTTGTQGETGIQGIQGIYGTQGTYGTQGIQGIQGIYGTQGATGTATQGTTGTQGIQGIRGASDWIPVFSGGTAYGADSNTFLKTSGNNNVWDGEVKSTVGYTNGAYITAQPTSTSQYTMFGLTTDPNASPSYSTIDYAWYLDGSNASIYENGSSIGTYGTLTTSTVLTITYDGYQIIYWKDGVAQRTVTVAISTPLYFDSSFYNNTSVGITAVGFGPMGSKGTQGIQGIQGIYGTQGIQGIYGNQGATGVSPGGTTNYVSKFTGATTIGNSQIFDNGTNVGIGTTTPSSKLHTVNEAFIGNSGGTTGLLLSGDNNSRIDFRSGSASTGQITCGNSSNLFIDAFDSRAIELALAGTTVFEVSNSANVGIGTAGSVNPSALLEVKSTTQGFLPPRMDEAERDAIGGPAIGLMVFNLGTDEVNVYTGAGWKRIQYI